VKRTHSRSEAEIARPSHAQARPKGPAEKPIEAVGGVDLSAPATMPMTQRSLLAIQRSAGNRAAASLVVSRQPRGAPQKQPVEVPLVVATIVFDRAGELRGTSKVPGHEGKVPFTSFNSSVSQARGRRGSEEEPEPTTELVLTRAMDAISPTLMQAMVDGDRIKTATFFFLRREDDGAVQVTHSITLTNGHLTGLEVGGGGGGDEPSERLSIQFASGAEFGR
jgi:type VI secretion system Hcp family effector